MAEASIPIPSQGSSERGCDPGRGSAPDDMLDGDIDWSPPLRSVLEWSLKELVPVYLPADEEAGASQTQHRWTSRIAVVCATGAIGVAIVELTRHALHAVKYEEVLTYLELVLVLGALIFFFFGELSRRSWLTERNKAERCRLLKFSTMLDPSLWGQVDSPALSAEKLRRDNINRIKEATYKQVGEWLDHDDLPAPPGRFRAFQLGTLDDLREYYLEKRLKFQREHFCKKFLQKETFGRRLWQNAPAILFVISVILVALHVGFSLKGGKSEAKLWLVMIAALLPVIGSGIRGFRAAWEPSRNQSRFRAKEAALLNVEARLRARIEARGNIQEQWEAEELLRDIWCAEQIIESEHREWLRLMKDAEWAG